MDDCHGHGRVGWKGAKRRRPGRCRSPWREEGPLGTPWVLLEQQVEASPECLAEWCRYVTRAPPPLALPVHPLSHARPDSIALPREWKPSRPLPINHQWTCNRQHTHHWSERALGNTHCHPSSIAPPPPSPSIIPPAQTTPGRGHPSLHPSVHPLCSTFHPTSPCASCPSRRRLRAVFCKPARAPTSSSIAHCATLQATTEPLERGQSRRTDTLGPGALVRRGNRPSLPTYPR